MLRHALLLTVLASALLASGCATGEKADSLAPLPDKPTVLIIGDSISMKGGYFPGLVERLGEDYHVVHNPGNGSDSANVLKHLDTWVDAAQPHIVHFNCGLHDLKWNRTAKTHQQPPDAYEANLKQIVAGLQSRENVRLVFALTTPVNEEWHRKKGFDRRDEDVREYNRIATRIMKNAGIPINDLYTVIAEAGPDTCLRNDGVHMNAKGNELLADKVAATIREIAGRPK